MITVTHKQAIWIGVALLGLYCWIDYSQPKAPVDRPILRWVASIAKSVMWIAIFADRPPAIDRDIQSAAGDGYKRINHGRSL